MDTMAGGGLRVTLTRFQQGDLSDAPESDVAGTT